MGLGAVGVLGLRYVMGLRGEANGGGFDSAGGVSDGPVNAPVERLDLTSSVAATGSLVSSKPLGLGFPGPGAITELNVAVGDQVVAGQVLARQDPRLAQLDLDAAQATLVAAERAAGLRGPGTTDEQRARDAQLAQARVAVTSATSALERTRAVTDANAVALQSAIDAAQRQLDRARADADSSASAVSAAAAAEPAATARQAALDELVAARAAVVMAREALVDAANALAAATAGGNSAAIATAAARQDAATITSDAAIARTADALAVVDGHTAATAATAAAHTSLAAADAGAAAAADAVISARDARRSALAGDAQTLDAAASTLADAKASLQVILTGTAQSGNGSGVANGGTSPEELQVAVDRAKLDVEKAQTALDRLTITAPVAATITKVDATLGDTLGDDAQASDDTARSSTAGSTSIITLTTPQQLVAEITVPETDAIKLDSGMAAEFKFSAIPDVIGTGKVLTILPTDAGANPAIDPFTGAPSTQKTYTITMSLDDPPSGARGGLSIAARVTIGSKQAALVVPTAALSEFEGTAVVQRVTGEGTEEVEVETGLRQGGYTQILSGLAEGDEVRIDSAFPADGGSAEDGVVVNGG